MAQPTTKPSGIPWLGEVPAHWDVKRMRYLGRYLNGYPFKPDEWEDVGRPIIRIQDLTESTQKPNYYSGELESRYLIKKGDTLLAWSTTLGIHRWEGEPAWLNQHIFKVELADFADRAFFYYAGNIMLGWKMGHRHGSTMSHLTKDELGDSGFPLPPLPEQRAIAAFLDERTARIDGLIARKQRLVQLLKEKRQALITRAVTRGLDAKVKLKQSGVQWLGEVPEHWGVKRIRHLCSVVRGSTPRPAGDERYFNGSAMPWITVSEITGATGMYITSTETCLTEEGVTYSRIVEEGTLLLSNSGATLGVPRIAGIRGCLNDGCAAFLRLVLQVDRDFLYYFFESHTAVYRADTQVSGQPNLNTDLIGSTLMAVPPLAEQRAIVHAIQRSSNHIDALITKVEHAVLRLQEYRTALISAAVTGKVRVPH